MILVDIQKYISELNDTKDFASFYQDYVKSIQDNIISNELEVNKHKMTHMKSMNNVLGQLNNLTEELKIL